MDNINYITDIVGTVLATKLFCSTGNIFFLRENSTNFICWARAAFLCDRL